MATIKSTKSILLVVAAVLVVIAMVTLVVFVMTRPTEADYASAQDSLYPKAVETQSKLPNAANRYFKAFRDAQVSSGSATKAANATADERKAYQELESAAQGALKELEGSRAANDPEVGVATDQYVDASNNNITYLGTLVASYDVYRSLFDGTDNEGCNGIFVGETGSLAERRDLLKAAIKNCRTVVDELKNSGNASYENYAITMDHRLSQLEEYSVRSAKGEADYEDFTVKLKTAQKKLAALDAKKASDKEYIALKDEIEEVNDQLNQSKSSFEAAASRYISTVKDMPGLYEDVFKESVPARQKSIESIVDIGSQVLEVVLDDKLIK